MMVAAVVGVLPPVRVRNGSGVEVDEAVVTLAGLAVAHQSNTALSVAFHMMGMPLAST